MNRFDVYKGFKIREGDKNGIEGGLLDSIKGYVAVFR